MVRTSDGLLHESWTASGSDLWYGNSSDKGVTWSKKEVQGGIFSFGVNGMLTNSNNDLYIYYEQQSFLPSVIQIINSTDNGTTWSVQRTIMGPVFPIGATMKLPSGITDKNDVLHFAAIDTSGGGTLQYVNSSDWNRIIINNNASDDTDFCDIAVDSKNTVCIVALGTDDKDLDVFCSIDGWVRHSIDEDVIGMFGIPSSAHAPTITVDNDDMFHVGYITAPGLATQLYHANFSASDLTSFSTQLVDSTISFYPDIGVSSQKDIHILYSDSTSLNAFSDIYHANKSFRSPTWDKREHFAAASNYPSIQDSRYPCSNRMTDTLRYTWTNSTSYVFFDNQSIYHPSCFPPCESDWVVQCSDNCRSDRKRDIRPYDFRMTGAGDFITYYDIWANDFNFDVTNCHGYFFDSFMRVE